MSLFSSREPFNTDPTPWTHDHGALCDEDRISGRHPIRTAEAIADEDYYDPRPAFNGPQHNRTNSALAHFRQLHGRKSAADVANAAAHWAASLRDMRIAGAYTEAEENHARAVFARLTSIGGAA